jgi:hypothetical protein
MVNPVRARRKSRRSRVRAERAFPVVRRISLLRGCNIGDEGRRKKAKIETTTERIVTMP